MLVTNHVLSGAVIGAAARNPWLAFPLGVASHLVLDAVPHWGRWDDKAHFMRVAVADGLTGLAAMGAAAAIADRQERVAVVAGMVGAALPDINKPTRVFFGFSPFPKRFDDFHGRIQDEAPYRRDREFAAGALFAAGFGALALWARHSRRPGSPGSRTRT